MIGDARCLLTVYVGKRRKRSDGRVGIRLRLPLSLLIVSSMPSNLLRGDSGECNAERRRQKVRNEKERLSRIWPIRVAVSSKRLLGRKRKTGGSQRPVTQSSTHVAQTLRKAMSVLIRLATAIPHAVHVSVTVRATKVIVHQITVARKPKYVPLAGVNRQR